MQKLTAVLHYYKNHLIPTLLFATLVGIGFKNPVMFVLTKIGCNFLLLASQGLSQKSNILCFYQNLGISRLQLLLWLILFDIVLLMILLPIVNLFI